MTQTTLDVGHGSGVPNVLVLDDHPGNLHLLGQLFEGRHVEVSFAKTGAAALRIASKVPFQLAILDVNLPDTDGFAVARSLREMQPGCEQIFCSAFNDRARRDRAFEEGAIDFIEKPFELEATKRRLALHLERLALRANLVTEKNRLETMLSSLQDAVVSTDMFDRIVTWNSAAERLFGVPREEALGTRFARFVPPHLSERHAMALETYRQGGGGHLVGKTSPTELPALHADGTLRTIELMLSEWSQAGERFMTAIVRDLTEAKALQDDLRKLRISLDRSDATIARITGDGHLIWATSEAMRRWFTEPERIDTPEVASVGDGPLGPLFDAYLAIQPSPSAWTTEGTLVDLQGRERVVTVSFSNLGERDDEILVIVTDVTELRGSQGEAERLLVRVRTDELTGCLSRGGFTDDYADGTRHHDLGLIILDVDYFKSLNDIYGHVAGDRYLVTLVETLRASLPPDTVVARLGGEEFAVTRPIESLDALRAFAQEVHDVASGVSIEVDERMVRRTVSLGASAMPVDARLSACLTLADEALQVSKQRGRDTIRIADDVLKEKLALRLARPSLEEVQAALAEGAIDYHLQPVFDVQNGRVEGFEALIRWDRSAGTLSPAAFLDEYYVVTNALDRGRPRFQAYASVIERLGARIEGWVSFNVRLSDLLDEACDVLVDTLGRYANGGRVVVELSEESILERMDSVLVTHELEKLRAAGFLIALDDFGKEGSNFNRLSDFPVDVVKLDKFFVDDIVTDARSQSMVKALVTLSHELNFKLVAEGIESQAQADTLLRLGVSKHQGYFYARPAPLAALTADTSLHADAEISERTIERSRQDLIRRFDVVATLENDTYVRSIVETAQRTFDVRSVAVTILGEDVQYLPVRVGTDLTHTARPDAICNHTVRADGIFEVCDTTLDARFRDNRLVTGDQASIRFYAGSPLTVYGRKVGALALLDDRDREPMSEFEKAQLVHMAQTIADRIMDLTASPAIASP